MLLIRTNRFQVVQGMVLPGSTHIFAAITAYGQYQSYLIANIDYVLKVKKHEAMLRFALFHQKGRNVHAVLSSKTFNLNVSACMCSVCPSRTLDEWGCVFIFASPPNMDPTV